MAGLLALSSCDKSGTEIREEGGVITISLSSAELVTRATIEDEDTYNVAIIISCHKSLPKFISLINKTTPLNTNIVTLIKKGGKPILMGFCCWAVITAVSIGMQLLTGIFFTSL